MHGGSEPAFLPARPVRVSSERGDPRRPLAKGQGPSKGDLILFSEGAKGGMTSEKQGEQPLVLGKQRVLRHGDGRGALRPEVSVGNKTRQMTIARSTFDKNGRLARAPFSS